MGIETIGIQGQLFTDKVFDLVQRIHTGDPELPIQIDGGVSSAVVQKLNELDVVSVVAGSSLFGALDPAAARAGLRALIRHPDRSDNEAKDLDE